MVGLQAVRLLMISLPRIALLIVNVECRSTFSLNLLQWNPHWQCFNESQSGDCRLNVPRFLDERLALLDVDFSNVVELNISWTPPSPWKSISAECSPSNLDCFDQDTLIYNSDRWVPSEESNASAKGCIQDVPHPNRPYIIQHFVSRGGEAHVIVVGAHYSHCSSIGTLESAIAQVMGATGASRVILLADTNRYSHNFNEGSSKMCNQTSGWAPSCGLPCPGAAICNTSSELLAQLLGQRFTGTVVSTDLKPSCCNSWVGFQFPFDRIIANFGEAMNTTLLDDPAPVWAGKEFHKAVFGQLTVHWDGSNLSEDHVPWRVYGLLALSSAFAFAFLVGCTRRATSSLQSSLLGGTRELRSCS